MIYNIAHKNYLQITSRRKLRQSKQKQEAKLEEVVQRLQYEDQAQRWRKPVDLDASQEVQRKASSNPMTSTASRHSEGDASGAF